MPHPTAHRDVRAVILQVLFPVDVVGAFGSFDLFHPLGSLHPLGQSLSLLGDALRGILGFAAILSVGGLIQDRILQHLLIDQIVELHTAQLQKLDGLLQLGRHHQLQGLLQGQDLSQLGHAVVSSLCVSIRKRSPK